MLAQIKETVAYLQSRTQVSPTVGIILGTGLGGLVNEINAIDVIPYEEIPNFPVSTITAEIA
jgi:purine-nucleoside phosphorylase